MNLTSLENDFGGTSADYDKVTNKLGVPDAVFRIMQIGSDAHICLCKHPPISGYVKLDCIIHSTNCLFLI